MSHIYVGAICNIYVVLVRVYISDDQKTPNLSTDLLLETK